MDQPMLKLKLKLMPDLEDMKDHVSTVVIPMLIMETINISDPTEISLIKIMILTKVPLLQD